MNSFKQIDILAFPGELLQEICLNLDWNSIFRTILVSKTFQQILESPLFWKCKVERDFGLGKPLVLKMPDLMKILRYRGSDDGKPKYKLSWKPETWMQRYRRIFLTRYYSSSNVIRKIDSIDGNVEHCYINSKFEIIYNKLNDKKMKNIPSRAINLYYGKQELVAITEDGLLHYSNNERLVWKHSRWHHNLICYVFNEEVSNICSGFITDNLTGYLEILTHQIHGDSTVTTYKSVLKLPILIRDISFHGNMAAFLGKDQSIYLCGIDHAITNNCAEISTTEIPTNNRGHLHKLSILDNIKFKQILFTNDYMLALSTDGDVYNIEVVTGPGKILSIGDDCYKDEPKLFSIRGLKIQKYPKFNKLYSRGVTYAAITEIGELYIWGMYKNNVFDGFSDRLDDSSYQEPERIPIGGKVKDVSINNDYILLLMEDGTTRIIGKIKSCPRCGSTNIRTGNNPSKSGDMKKRLHICNDCKVQWIF